VRSSQTRDKRRLSARDFDHLSPLLGFGREKLGEIGGRAGEWRAAQLGNPRPHLGVGKGGVEFLIKSYAPSALAMASAFKSRSKLSNCAFSLVDLPKEVSVADFAQQRPRSYLVCPVDLFS
jgi:hypothetical protein